MEVSAVWKMERLKQYLLRCKFKRRIGGLLCLLDIIKHLQSFLSHDDNHYFLNSNKLHFTSLKQETIYFLLTKEKSREYVEDERFRETILSKVKDGIYR